MAAANQQGQVTRLTTPPQFPAVFGIASVKREARKALLPLFPRSPRWVRRARRQHLRFLSCDGILLRTNNDEVKRFVPVTPSAVDATIDLLEQTSAESIIAVATIDSGKIRSFLIGIGDIGGRAALFVQVALITIRVAVAAKRRWQGRRRERCQYCRPGCGCPRKRNAR
jgi:hypothetical protein